MTGSAGGQGCGATGDGGSSVSGERAEGELGANPTWFPPRASIIEASALSGVASAMVATFANSRANAAAKTGTAQLLGSSLRRAATGEASEGGGDRGSGAEAS
eukprot:CAMPEP_0171064260 /NCGR_PEP_ID=MMETSP0766_2-20121228/6172_1 /TAXON_ID=439317 /ORGANISM="Gambierdiscus australes, Strain CAWD 149" /LENGTH=102 /DNA_ID=CAMNT_0011520269 /DNA_START=260 /DNA_END=569 /DNA_ORIENTATION=+